MGTLVLWWKHARAQRATPTGSISRAAVAYMERVSMSGRDAKKAGKNLFEGVKAKG